MRVSATLAAAVVVALTSLSHAEDARCSDARGRYLKADGPELDDVHLKYQAFYQYCDQGLPAAGRAAIADAFEKEYKDNLKVGR